MGLLAAAYGITQVKIDFKSEFLITDSAYVYDILNKSKDYFAAGFTVTHYVDNPNLDYASEDVQVQLINFNERLAKCHGCDEDWHEENTLRTWYEDLARWVRSKECQA